MIDKRTIIAFVLCIILLTGSSKVAVPEARVRPEIDITFEYDDNVTREGLRSDYQYGVISRLTTGFRIEDFIPAKRSEAGYELRMRDVNTTNDEDYSSQRFYLRSQANLRTGTTISLKDDFRLLNSQSDLFNFYDNTTTVRISQFLGDRTTVFLSYTNRQKRFRNSAPEVQARNYSHNQIGVLMDHGLSATFKAQVGYDYGVIMYNRSPIDFKGDMPIALDGVQRDRQNVVTLGIRGMFLNGKALLSLRDQVISSDSNSRAFDFNGNKAELRLQVGPFKKLSADLEYRIVAYNVEAHHTRGTGYELTEARSDDQSGMMLGIKYDIPLDIWHGLL